MTDAELRDLERAVKVNARVTTALIVLIAVFVVAAGGYGYWRVREALRPQNVAAEAEQYVHSHYPEWRAELKKEMVKSAPKLADRFSRRAVKSIPDARVRLERQLDALITRGLDRTQEASTEELREFVRQNKADIRQAYAEVKQSPDEARAAVKRTEAAFEKRFGVGVQAEAREALSWIRAFNERLREAGGTAPPGSDAEEAERRIARLLKALTIRGQESAAGK